MDPSAPIAQTQSDSNGTGHPSNQQPNHPAAPSLPATRTHAVPASDLNSLPQADLSNLHPLQGLPADMNLLSMMPQDGTLLTDNELMGMPLMMPMMMDDNSMLNIPQNGITNGMSTLSSFGTGR